MNRTDEITTAIRKCLTNPTDENAKAVAEKFWHLPDGDDAQALRFCVYAIRVLHKRGTIINIESIIDYLKRETFDEARPCKKFLVLLTNETK